MIMLDSPLPYCLADQRTKEEVLSTARTFSTPSLSFHSTAPSTDCTSAPDSPFDRLERSSRPTSTSVSLPLCD